MPTQDSYKAVATNLARMLGRKPFLTLTRREVTTILRTITGEERTRIKILGSAAIMEELNNLGLTTYPDLYEVGTNESLRLFRTDSFLNELVSVITEPNEETDARLKAALSMVPTGNNKNTLAGV